MARKQGNSALGGVGVGRWGLERESGDKKDKRGRGGQRARPPDYHFSRRDEDF